MRSIMSSTSNLKNHHISVLSIWNRGIRSTSLIHRETSIPLSTIYHNIDKLKGEGSLKHRGKNGRTRALGKKEKKAISQYIRYTVKKAENNKPSLGVYDR